MPSVNTAKIKQIFLKLANELPVGDQNYPFGLSKTPERQMLKGSLIIRGSVVLYADAADRYFAALEEIVAIAGNSRIWSRSSLDDALMEHLKQIIFCDVANRPKMVRDQSAALLKQLNLIPDEWIVEISVFGMNAECTGLVFGNLTFLTAPVESSVTIPGFIEEGRPSEFLFARTSVEAIDAKSALLRANAIVEEHLSVLHAVCSKSIPSIIRLYRRTELAQLRSISRVTKGKDFDSGHAVQMENPAILLQRYDFSKILESRAGTAIGERLRNTNDFARRLIAAYVTAGNAAVERERHLAFLLFAIAMESAVLGKNTQSELAHQLSVRIAHLLGASLDDRREIVTLVKRLYDLRSKVVHTGQTEVGQNDLEEMQRICLSTLLALTVGEAFKNMQAVADLERWFQDQVLGPPVVAE